MVETENKVEEIIVKEQPLEQSPAPIGQIKSEETKPDEVITATTTVQQQPEPEFQVSSSVIQPEKTTTEIIVQTEVGLSQKRTNSVTKH